MVFTLELPEASKLEHGGVTKPPSAPTAPTTPSQKEEGRTEEKVAEREVMAPLPPKVQPLKKEVAAVAEVKRKPHQAEKRARFYPVPNKQESPAKVVPSCVDPPTHGYVSMHEVPP